MTNTQDVKAPSDGRYQSKGFTGGDRIPITLERIMVPTDLTAESEQAVEYGFVLAQRLGAHLALLHVYQAPHELEYIPGRYASDAWINDRTASRNTLKSITEEIQKHYADCDFEFRDGVPSEEILKTANERNIDLIVISTHHCNWLTRLVYGSDADQISHHAPCPILLLPVKEEDRS